MYWATGVLGVVLIIAPYIFNYASNVQALWSSIILGAAIVVLSFISWLQRNQQDWEYWAEEGIGILAIIAPFAIGFNQEIAALWTTIVIGIMLIAVAGWRLFSRPTHQIK